MTRTYPHGVPCWVDVEAADPEAAQAFYGGLLGWAFEGVAPGYWIATLDGRDVAAVGEGAAGWSTYVAVDDADAAAERAAAHGGTVTAGPQDAGPGGRAASCLDPAGAAFRLWQARARPGAQLVNAPGTWNFSDLHTSDAEGAKRFYAALFGWEAEDLGFATMWRRPGYGDHLEATVDPEIRTRQSAVAAPPGFEDCVAWLAPSETPHWHVTFAVADRDEAVAGARRLGAEVLSTDDSDWTRAALIRDPQGAELTLSQFTPPSG